MRVHAIGNPAGQIATGRPGELLPTRAAGSRSFGWWGMVWLIATEATIFALLIASYFYLRFRAGPVWPPEPIEAPELALPLVMTAILWSSSIPVHLADRAVRRGNQTMLRIGLLAGFVMGAVFLALQVAVEYPEVLRHFTPQTNAYGSLFFTLTGFHGVHVAVGLLMSLWVQMKAWRGAFDEDHHVGVEAFTMYWHFVDVVWFFVLAALYLSPHV